MAQCAFPVAWPFLTPTNPSHKQSDSASPKSTSYAPTLAAAPPGFTKPVEKIKLQQDIFIAPPSKFQIAASRPSCIVPAVPLMPEQKIKSIASLSDISEEDDIPSNYYGPPIGYSIKRVRHKSFITGLESVTFHGNPLAPRNINAIQCDADDCSVCKPQSIQKTTAFTPTTTKSDKTKYAWQGQPPFTVRSKPSSFATPSTKQAQRDAWNERMHSIAAGFPPTPTKHVKRKSSEENGLEVYGGCEKIISVKKSPPLVPIAVWERALS